MSYSLLPPCIFHSLKPTHGESFLVIQTTLPRNSSPLPHFSSLCLQLFRCVFLSSPSKCKFQESRDSVCIVYQSFPSVHNKAQHLEYSVNICRMNEWMCCLLCTWSKRINKHHSHSHFCLRISVSADLQHYELTNNKILPICFPLTWVEY